MAIFFDAPVAPDALTAFVREVPTPLNLALSNLFPVRYLQTNTIDFAEIVKTNRTAKYRSFDGRISVSDRDTGSEKRVSLAPLSTSLNMGEFERLQLEFARTAGTNKTLLANSVYNDAQTLTGEVQNRIELAWGDVLSDGKLSINENGLVSEADYGVPANHIVAPSTVWTTIASAKALDDIIAWTDTYAVTNGVAPGSFRTSRRVARLLQTNAQIVAAVYGATSGRTRVSLTELNDVLSGEGLPVFGGAYDTQLDVDGTATRVIADNKVIFLPETISDLGYTAYGVSATALELVKSTDSDLTFENAPGIVGIVVKQGPPFRQFTYVDAVGQPVLANAKLLMVANVA